MASIDYQRPLGARAREMHERDPAERVRSGWREQRHRHVQTPEPLQVIAGEACRRAVRAGSQAARRAFGRVFVAPGLAQDDVLEPLSFVVHLIGAGDRGELALARACERGRHREQRADAIGQQAHCASLLERHRCAAVAARHQDEARAARPRPAPPSPKRRDGCRTTGAAVGRRGV